ncbi:DUF3987 domain-containing protein [Roseicella aerolata]|uniref:DUF3987 domain-containing protein n=1 Tax=Roseicella aerolata TaxID=2883479 RepID=A0A9X1IJ26_9PROT|nr:DUF3987 domain-containing protein [Roseicella aerolata]MCB4825570.1 DUF3987 domain-containing protein [Roseicella aerolata]
MSVLRRSAIPAPPLPLDVLGPDWASWIEQCAEASNAPPDYVAMPLLALASALMGNARWVSGWDGWHEPPALWCASVGNPSSGKSSGAAPVMRDVLNKLETRMARSYPMERAQWEEAATVASIAEKQWEKEVAAAMAAGNPVPPKPRAAMSPPKPVEPRLRITDATIERVAELLSVYPKGLLCSRDELTGWLLNQSRYSSGTDRPFWLEAYNGGSYKVDRQKHPDPISIGNLTVSMFGTIQPDRLAAITQSADDGLPSRFLFLLCHLLLGRIRCFCRQQGQRGRRWTRPTVRRRRMLAIECGTWRSGRTGTARLEAFG